MREKCPCVYCVLTIFDTESIKQSITYPNMYLDYKNIEIFSLNFVNLGCPFFFGSFCKKIYPLFLQFLSGVFGICCYKIYIQYHSIKCMLDQQQLLVYEFRYLFWIFQKEEIFDFNVSFFQLLTYLQCVDLLYYTIYLSTLWDIFWSRYKLYNRSISLGQRSIFDVCFFRATFISHTDIKLQSAQVLNSIQLLQISKKHIGVGISHS
eukprot:TRINITY_DN2571_c0_g1_i4.p3 TRINITY_DN2571_c0_g1~~TRINITY_DN2571_c0_g1_i4.p3  ORF type:complete len:207 (-),score=-19.08 TRINITY_DN2571_c0_g1_i4:408-1028(-)